MMYVGTIGCGVLRFVLGRVLPVLWVVILAACSSPPLGLDPATDVPADSATLEAASEVGSTMSAHETVEAGAKSDVASAVMQAIADASVEPGDEAMEGGRDAVVVDGAWDVSELTDGATEASPDGGPRGPETGPADSGDLNVRSDAGDGRCVPVSCGTHSWACWPVPNASAGRPYHFTDMGDGVLRDDTTCLLWQQMPADQGYTWSDAIVRCTKNPLVGGTGWRLPTRIEMISVTDYTRRGPAVTPLAKRVLLNPPYWTSSPFDAIAGNAYLVSLYDGVVSYADETGQYLAWCVRGNGEAADLPATAPPDHYTIRIDDVVDNYTGLVWQRGDSQALSLGGLGANEAAAYCKNLAVGGAAWRLPNVPELATLVDETRIGKAEAAIDAMAFPTTPEMHYWTSVKYASNTWTVDFKAGLTAHDQAFAQTRCVH